MSFGLQQSFSIGKSKNSFPANLLMVVRASRTKMLLPAINFKPNKKKEKKRKTGGKNASCTETLSQKPSVFFFN